MPIYVPRSSYGAKSFILTYGKLACNVSGNNWLEIFSIHRTCVWYSSLQLTKIKNNNNNNLIYKLKYAIFTVNNIAVSLCTLHSLFLFLKGNSMLTDIVTFFFFFFNLYTVDFYDLSTKFCSETCKLFWFSIVKFMIGVER